VVRAEIPLVETFGYAGARSALKHGHGRFTLEPARHEQAPDSRARAIEGPGFAGARSNAKRRGESIGA